jgi:hypothetical protein
MDQFDSQTQPFTQPQEELVKDDKINTVTYENKGDNFTIVKNGLIKLLGEEFIDFIKNNMISIYGGIIRDIIAGDTPNNIDVIVSYKKHGDFWKYITRLGYTRNSKLNQHVDSYSKQGSLDINIYNVEMDPKKDILYPSNTIPDFDVNLLAFNGQYLYEWTNSPTLCVANIIDRIKRREAIQHEATHIGKIEDKGYKIIKIVNIYEYKE